MAAPSGPFDRSRARPHPKPAPRSAPPTARRDGAERLAIQALGFLAAEPERLDPFLAQAGLAPDTLRRAAAAPGFLAAVLDFLTADEPALLAFCAEAGLAPEMVAAARETLAGDGAP